MEWPPRDGHSEAPVREVPPLSSNGRNGATPNGTGRLVEAEVRGIETADAAAELLLALGSVGQRWRMHSFRWEGGVVTAQLELRAQPAWPDPASYSSK